MKKMTMTMMGLLLAAAVATSAYAFAPGRGPGYGPASRGDWAVARGLDLTAEQKTKITELRNAHLKDVRPLQEQRIAKRDALRKLWLEPNPDQGKIAAAQKELNAVRDTLQEKRTSFRLAALNVLTAEQKEKVKSWTDQRGFGKAGAKRSGAKAPRNWHGRGCVGGGPGLFGR